MPSGGRDEQVTTGRDDDGVGDSGNSTTTTNTNTSSSGLKYLIIRPEGGGIKDLFNLLITNNSTGGAGGGGGGGAIYYNKFIQQSSISNDNDDQMGMGIGGPTPISNNNDDHRWVIIVSIIVRKIIGVFGKPMEWCGYLVEFLLNLLSHNGGNLFSLFLNLVTGKLVIPHRDSDTFISTIGHLDGRVDLYNGDIFTRFQNAIQHSKETSTQVGDRALMDFCIMASKLAYENAKVVRNIVVHHWKMHFVEFFNGWNEFQKERSTQVFILSDKPVDANLIIISFRGTEPFDPDDWSTDFDYSWYEIPKLGKVHMGFLEALGLGNRAEVSTFQEYLQIGGDGVKGTSQQSEVGAFKPSMVHPSNGSEPATDFDSEDTVNQRDTEESTCKKKPMPIMGEMTAYYGVRSRLKNLLDEHKNAKFVVTGHSLGGALAILFPTILLLHEEKEMMQRLLGVCTFGQPRVGDRKLGRFMESHLNHPSPKYFRVVYCNDLVPRLPYDNKTFLFKHFGMCLYYDSKYVEQ
ncbi:hypothetical protein AQUCO_02000608v1 [Aquilegia coerulea]|nr:hypothetical protein AQUCO_02000608v1 [Aquilegia coerulea]